MSHALRFDMSVTNINSLKVPKVLAPVSYFCILPNSLQHAIIPSRDSTNMGIWRHILHFQNLFKKRRALTLASIACVLRYNELSYEWCTAYWISHRFQTVAQYPVR